jgi:ABC-2 type transport system ATP-binding protein
VADHIIELVDLTKKYGSFTAVDKLCLTVGKGEIFGLLGPNGAGKSTTILMMLGLTDPTSGIVNVCGLNPTQNAIAVKRKVGYLPEDVGFYDDLTGLENLSYTARLNGMTRSNATKIAREILKKVGLTEAMDKKAGKYSRGMRQRLGLADVLVKSPEVIILDEPTLGIDPNGVREFLNLIVSLSREEGITVLFSSHHLHQVQQVCDRVGLFVKGKLLAQGNIQSLSQKLFTSSPFVIEAGLSKQTNNLASMSNLLRQIKGVTAVKEKDGLFEVECSSDLTSDIAKAIVNAGAGLTYLNKKEYGLDDIYYRYFEGGENHE